MGIVLAAGQAQQDLDLDQRAVVLLARGADLLELAHADREQDVDRVLADDGVEHAAGRIDQVAAGVDGEADAAVDRRQDVGIGEVHPSLGQRRLGLQHGGLGALQVGAIEIDRRLRDVLVLHQLDRPVVLQLGVDLLGLRRGEIGRSLVDVSLELDLLDLVQQLALLDVIAFAEQHPLEEALDAGAQLDHLDGLDAADEIIALADPLDRGRHDPDRGRRRRCRRRLLLAASGDEQEQQRGDEEPHQRGWPRW